MPGQRLLLGTVLSVAVAAIGWRRGSLTPDGAAGATLVGALTFGLGGPIWGVLLVVFFVSSSLLSHFRADHKQSVAEKFDKGHRRDLGQVLANGGAGALAAVLATAVPHPAWFAFFLGAIATVTADTWATELGTLSRRAPRLITNGRVAPVGTSGAVSPLGTGVSLAGGALIGLTAGFLAADVSLLAVTIVGALAGLAGSLFDSLLGATVQSMYICEACGKETERRVHHGQPTRPLRGWPWLDNDRVNFVASLVGGATAVGLYLWLM